MAKKYSASGEIGGYPSIRSHRFPIRRISPSESFCPCFVPDYRQAPVRNSYPVLSKRRSGTKSIACFQARHSGNYLGRIRNLSAESLIPRTLKLGWAYNTEIIGQRYDRTEKNAIEMAELLAREGISVLVFKGLSMSMYYPVPEHRECGDIDIWLFGQAEKGNRVAKAAGAKVEKENSKHDIIYFHGVPFENHKELTSELLNSRNRLINKDLITRVKDDRTQPLFATDTLRTPSRVFDELYIPVHAAGHFVVEGISLRHLCDWALIVQANGGIKR